jgi:hypothetical protein
MIIFCWGATWVVLHAQSTPSFAKFIRLCGIGLLENSITSAGERAKLLYAKRGILIAEHFRFDRNKFSIFFLLQIPPNIAIFKRRRKNVYVTADF